MWEERGPTDNDRRHVASISGIWKLNYFRGIEFHREAVAERLDNLIRCISAEWPALQHHDWLGQESGRIQQRPPEHCLGVNPFLDPNRSRALAATAWFNKAAFTANGPGLGIGPGSADGTTPRNYLRAPGYRNIDLGLLRDIRFADRYILQLRGEATNVFNMVSLNSPSASLSSASVGQITGAATPRLVQVGARFTF